MRFAVRAAILLVWTALPAQTPSVRPQFEVASVKPAKDELNGKFPMMREMMRNSRPSGMIPMAGADRVHLENWTLLDLIAAAYSVRAAQVSGPDWLSIQVFDIDAKVPDGTAKEELNGMLQSLLEERFGLKAHRSTQAGPGFALTVSKDGPRLEPAQPPPTPAEGVTEEEQRAQVQQKAQAGATAAGQRMRERMQELGGRDAPLEGYNTVSWGSITTEGLAAHLVRMAGGPVVDETGLTGKYSVTLETWKGGDVPGGTVFDAVERLGLKLEPRKVSVDTIVVDVVSKMPTAN